MSYYTGTVSSLSDLRTALFTHAQADGWTLSGNVLSKAGVYFEITVDANNIKCLGCESNEVSNPAPSPVCIGRIWYKSGYPTRQISFPCSYEVHGFSQELYLVVNYDVDSYQFLAFGKSTIPGLPGQGGWCTASAGNGDTLFANNNDVIAMIATGAGAMQQNGTGSAPCWPFFAFQPAIGNSRNGWVNHGLDGHGWTWNGSGSLSTYMPIGAQAMLPLINLQPSAWNSEAALLPIRAWKERPSYKASLVADLEHARLLRIDNLAPGDILTLGSDKWKTYPLYRKNSAQRGAGTNVNHTGTFGWAIRYLGP